MTTIVQPFVSAVRANASVAPPIRTAREPITLHRDLVGLQQAVVSTASLGTVTTSDPAPTVAYTTATSWRNLRMVLAARSGMTGKILLNLRDMGFDLTFSSLFELFRVQHSRNLRFSTPPTSMVAPSVIAPSLNPEPTLVPFREQLINTMSAARATVGVVPTVFVASRVDEPLPLEVQVHLYEWLPSLWTLLDHGGARKSDNEVGNTRSPESGPIVLASKWVLELKQLVALPHVRAKLSPIHNDRLGYRPPALFRPPATVETQRGAMQAIAASFAVATLHATPGLSTDIAMYGESSQITVAQFAKPRTDANTLYS